jgi:PGF-CTERM protein
MPDSARLLPTVTERTPRVSVILTTYNRTNLLPRAIDGVLRQAYRDWELLIVDDASEEDTAAVVDGYDDERIRLLAHDRNRGAAAARNTGIEHARGEYVAMLDDDDEWIDDGKLGTQDQPGFGPALALVALLAAALVAARRR